MHSSPQRNRYPRICSQYTYSMTKYASSTNTTSIQFNLAMQWPAEGAGSYEIIPRTTKIFPRTHVSAARTINSRHMHEMGTQSISLGEEAWTCFSSVIRWMHRHNTRSSSMLGCIEWRDSERRYSAALHAPRAHSVAK